MAKKVAEIIDFELTGEKRFAKLFRTFKYENKTSLKPEGGKMHHCKKLTVKERVGNFQEVSQGLYRRTGETGSFAMSALRCQKLRIGRTIWQNKC